MVCLDVQQHVHRPPPAGTRPESGQTEQIAREKKIISNATKFSTQNMLYCRKRAELTPT